MDSIRIESSKKRIAINDDPQRVIEFDPQDILFAERFYQLYGEMQGKLAEFEARENELRAQSEPDENGIPRNIESLIGHYREICDYLRDRIDRVFGVGTSQTVFGEARSVDMIIQFLDGLTPFIQGARSATLKKYSPVQNDGKVMKA